MNQPNQPKKPEAPKPQVAPPAAPKLEVNNDNADLLKAQLSMSQRETQKILKLANMYKGQITQLEMRTVDLEMKIEELQEHTQKLEAVIKRETS